MLAGLTFGDKSALEQEHLAEARASKEKGRQQKKKQKKEKTKKHTKETSKKQRAKTHSSGSEPSDGGSDDEWLKQQQAAGSAEDSPAAAGGGSGGNGLQREDWMTVPMARSDIFQEDETPKEETTGEPEEAPVVAGIRYRNPEQAAVAAERAAAREAAAAAGGDGGLRGPVSAAAGVSWRMKAVARAGQLAKEQGRDVNQVLSERWGSAAEIAKGLIESATAAAEGGQAGSRHPSRGSSHRPAAGRDVAAAPQYLSRVGSEQPVMKRPAGLGSGNKLSWRRPHAGEDGKDRDRDRQQDARATEFTENTSSSSRQAGDYSRRPDTEDRRSHDSRQRYQDEGRQQSHRRGSPQRDRGGSSPDSPKRQRQHYDREAGRRASLEDMRMEGDSKDHDRDRQHSMTQQGRRDRDNSREERNARNRPERPQEQQQRQRDDERGRPPRPSRQEQQQQQQKAEVVEALKAVAGHINTYSNDGSFLQQLTKQQAQQQGEQQPAGGRDRGGDEQQQQQQGGNDSRSSAEPATPAAAAGNNRSAAELLRARLAGKTAGAVAPAAVSTAAAGNKSVAEALRARLSSKPAAAAAADTTASLAGSDRVEVVQLPLVDASGRAAPGAFGRESAAQVRRQQEVAAGGRLAKRVQRYGADGQRERYFADDDNVDLQTLVKRAKYGDDSMNLDRTMGSNIAARSRFKQTDLDADAEYDHDAGLELSDIRRKRGDSQQQHQRERQRQISQFSRAQRLEDKCSYCFSSAVRPKELAVAVGQATYLSLVQRGRLVEGHCCIVTAEHVASVRQVDDNTWTEIRNFQKCLIRMFMEVGKEVLFLETATSISTHRNHAVMECIPVDQETFSKAPMYFKKALQEAESDWSQHASKAVIDTKAKGLRGSIPANFPYMYIQFGYANGFVHVIDDETKFDRDLGRQVIVGLLKLPAEVMHKKQRADAPQVQANMASAFRQQFAQFDWTKALD